MIKISMLDFDVKKATFSACTIMTGFCILVLFSRIAAWVMLAVFGGLACWLGYDLFIKHRGKATVDVLKAEDGDKA